MMGMNAVYSVTRAGMAQARLKGRALLQRGRHLTHTVIPKSVKFSDLKSSGHWPTLVTAFLYFDFSFMVWTVLGPLGAAIGESLHLSSGQKGLMVALPILSGAFLRIVLGLLVDRIGAKMTGLLAQVVVMAGLLGAWML